MYCFSSHEFDDENQLVREFEYVEYGFIIRIEASLSMVNFVLLRVQKIGILNHVITLTETKSILHNTVKKMENEQVQ